MAKKPAIEGKTPDPQSVLLNRLQSQALISIWRDRARTLEQFQQELSRIDESVQELCRVYAGIHQLPTEGGYYRFENSKEEELILRLEWVPEKAAEPAEKPAELQSTENASKPAGAEPAEAPSEDVPDTAAR